MTSTTNKGTEAAIILSEKNTKDISLEQQEEEEEEKRRIIYVLPRRRKKIVVLTHIKTRRLYCFARAQIVLLLEDKSHYMYRNA